MDSASPYNIRTVTSTNHVKTLCCIGNVVIGGNSPDASTTVNVSNTNASALQTPRVPNSKPDSGTSRSSATSELIVTPIATTVVTKNMATASNTSTASDASLTRPMRNNTIDPNRVSSAAPSRMTNRNVAAAGILVKMTAGTATATITIIAMTSRCTVRALRVFAVSAKTGALNADRSLAVIRLRSQRL